MTQQRTFKGKAVVLGSSAVLAAAFLSACSQSNQPDYAGVCYDKKTHQRVEDKSCDRDPGGHGWMYYPMGRTYPGVGNPLAAGGTTKPPKDSSFTRGGVSARGGTLSDSSVRSGTSIHGKGGGSVARGGFGGGAGGHGG